MNLILVVALVFISSVSCASLKESKDGNIDFFLEESPAEIIQAEITKGQASLMHKEQESPVGAAAKAAAAPKAAKGKIAEPKAVTKTPLVTPVAHVAATPASKITEYKATESDLVSEIVNKITGVDSKTAAAVKKHAEKHAAQHKSELDQLKQIEEELNTSCQSCYLQRSFRSRQYRRTDQEAIDRTCSSPYCYRCCCSSRTLHP
jgi:hypothetical protein